MDANIEESTSLKPPSPGTCQMEGKRQITISNHEKRLKSVRLGACYYLQWILLFLTTVVIPFYEWFFIETPECWSARYGHIMVSVFVAMLTCFVSAVLSLLNFMTRHSISYWRLNFCAISFILLTILSIINFLIGIYFFAVNTCYFAQITPYERVNDDEYNWFEVITIKYDLKLIGLLHLVCCLFSFTIGIGFAIIKNNFKYIRQIDIE